MMAEPDCLELCARLSRSLTRARLLPDDAGIDVRLDRLDDVLGNCLKLLTALEVSHRHAALARTPAPTGRAASNVIPFPKLPRQPGSESN